MKGRPKVGTAPINWNNDDLKDWAPLVPFPAILDEMAAAGYEGTELGSIYPAEPAGLRIELERRGLALSGAYRWLPLLDPAALDAEMPALDQLLDLLSALDAHDLIVASRMEPRRIALAGRVPADGSAGLSDDEWRTLVESLTRISRRAAENGIRTHYHNHAGSYVETPAEVERFLSLVDPAVADLCFDAGHYAFGGGDPADFVARHVDRIGYVHLKDVDPAVLARARAEGLGFLDALRVYVFCELGEGIANVPQIVRCLLDHGYSGWIIVEQDTSRRPSTESARASREYLRQRCGL